MKRDRQAGRDGTIRLGAGAGFAGDRIDPSVELATRGQLDVLAFEILAERTIALALSAGLDMELPAADYYGVPLKAEIESGRMPTEVLDTAVRRVLAMKFALSLFE